MVKNRKRIVSIDLLRVLAIIMVIGFHFFYQFDQNQSLRKIGFLGISLFFIISGFVLAKIYPKHEKFSLRWFLKRYSRIAVLYYLALISVVILFGKQVYSGSLMNNLLFHFAFLDPFTKYAYGIISPAWFLTPLIGLYILFPYLNKYLKKSTWILVIPFIIMIALRIYKGTYTGYSPLFFLGEFCFGIAFANGKKHLALFISLLSMIVQPFMVIPYFIFYILYSINGNYLPGRLLSFIGAYTLPLFLFHEGYLRIIFGRWHIYNLNQFGAMFLLTIVVFVCIYIDKIIQKLLSKVKYIQKL